MEQLISTHALLSRKYSEADSVAFDLHKVFSSHLCHLSLCKTLELRFMNLDTKVYSILLERTHMLLLKLSGSEVM